MSDTTTIAEFVASNGYDDVPEVVVAAAKTHLRDTVGVGLAGSRTEVGEIALGHVETTNPGDAATVLGRDTANAEGAAFANGVLSHALEWDDTPGGPHHLSHPSPPTLPAALAAAELADASGRVLLTGYVTGIETLSRLELASFPDHYFHGWHDTSTYGVFGAVAAAASILDLDVEAVTNALGIAASCSAGLRKNNGTMTKPFHAGHAASDGLRAAMLAREGFTADHEIVDGPIGYGAVYSPGEYNPSVLRTFGDEWHVLEFGYKPFPGITFNHGAQTALLRVVEREDLSPDDVESISVQLSEEGYETLWNEEPEDPYAAIASIEFNLAVVLRERGHGLDHFSAEYVTAPETQEQMRKVTRIVGFEKTDDFDMFGARVIVKTTDGREFVEEERYSPLQVSDERLEAKFYECAEAVLDREQVERVDEAVTNLEDDGELQRLFDAICTG